MSKVSFKEANQPGFSKKLIIKEGVEIGDMLYSYITNTYDLVINGKVFNQVPKKGIKKFINSKVGK